MTSTNETMFDIDPEVMPTRLLPAEPLMAVLGMSSLRTLSDKLEVNVRTVQRYVKVGLTFDQADRIAIALGMHPMEIWHDWLEG